MEHKNALDEIDRRATALYDELNPNSDAIINVSKAECLRRIIMSDAARGTITQSSAGQLLGVSKQRAHQILNQQFPNREKRRKEIPIRRRFIRAAYDFVRHDPTETKIAKNFLDALAGRDEITETLLDSAQRIIADRAKAAVG